MELLDDGQTVGASCATSATGATGTTGSATGVVGAVAGSTGIVGATARANSAATMGSVANADAGAALPADAAGAVGTGTATVVVSTRSGSTGATRATGRSTATSAMVVTTISGTSLTTGTKIQADKTDGTQVSISLPLPKANLAKYIHKTPTYDQRSLGAQLHTFLLQDSPDLTQSNNDENKPVMGIINIPKSSTIRVLHSFGFGTNLIKGSSTISGNIYFTGDGLFDKPPHAMVLPREVFHKTSIRVPN